MTKIRLWAVFALLTTGSLANASLLTFAQWGSATGVFGSTGSNDEFHFINPGTGTRSFVSGLIGSSPTATKVEFQFIDVLPGMFTNTSCPSAPCPTTGTQYDAFMTLNWVESSPATVTSPSPPNPPATTNLQVLLGSGALEVSIVSATTVNNTTNKMPGGKNLLTADFATNFGVMNGDPNTPFWNTFTAIGASVAFTSDFLCFSSCLVNQVDGSLSSSFNTTAGTHFTSTIGSDGKRYITGSVKATGSGQFQSDPGFLVPEPSGLFLSGTGALLLLLGAVRAKKKV